jgi:hypothetical protein
MAITVKSLRLFSAIARSTLRPMRPKPFIATLTVMVCLPLKTGFAWQAFFLRYN